ncbi:MAG: hypothetical protein K2H30_02695, partial [Clostridia bacterium]|nr:hypothetical protein [Clostridia bacterium]
MKKKISFLLCTVMFVVAMFSLTACTDENGGGTVDENYQGSTIPVDGEKYNASTVYCEITITA